MECVEDLQFTKWPSNIRSDVSPLVNETAFDNRCMAYCSNGRALRAHQYSSMHPLLPKHDQNRHQRRPNKQAHQPERFRAAQNPEQHEHAVRPVLIGGAARLPFLLVLFGILGRAETFGLVGLFIGPALMTILVVLWNDWVH